MPGRGRRLLLVEDDDSYRAVLGRYLEMAHFGVIAVPDSNAALQASDRLSNIDAAVIDIRMPAGQPHGVALAHMLKVRRPGLPMCLVTAYPELVERAAPLPCRVVFKTDRLSDVVTGILDALDHCGPGAAAPA